MIDVLVLLLCGVAAFMGWRRGALLTVLPVVAIAAGYAAAVVLYEPIGTRLMNAFGVPPLAAYGVGGALALFGTAAAFRALGWWVRRRQSEPAVEFFEEEDDEGGEPAPRSGSGPPPASRYGGAALGAAWAFAVAMILVWGVESVVAMNDSTQEMTSVTGRIGGQAVGGVARALVDRKTGDDFTATTAAALFRDPAGFARMTNALFANPDFQRLVSDPELPELLAQGRVEELAGRPELRRLLQDPEFRRFARRAGVTTDVDVGSTKELAEALSRSLGPVASAVTSLREDAQLMETVRQLDLAERLASGNVMTLLGDRDLMAIGGRVVEELRRQDR